MVLFIAASLDGYIAKEGDDLDWLHNTEGQGDNGYSEMYATIDTMVMGYKTYHYIKKNLDTFPHSDKKCYVFSRSQKGSNEDAEFINEDVISFTKKLKAKQGKKIWMVGGATLLDDFMKEKLIDEIIITFTPHILGSGVPLFKENNPEQSLTLLELKRFNQFAQLCYKVNHQSGDVSS
jgi:dihydrofolate reductase